MFKRLPAEPSKPPPVLTEVEQAPEEMLDIEEVVQDIPAAKSVSRVLSKNAKIRWNAMEMDLVSTEKSQSHRQAYNQYEQKCQELKLNVRTFYAFRKKRSEMMKDE